MCYIDALLNMNLFTNDLVLCCQRHICELAWWWVITCMILLLCIPYINDKFNFILSTTYFAISELHGTITTVCVVCLVELLYSLVILWISCLNINPFVLKNTKLCF